MSGGDGCPRGPIMDDNRDLAVSRGLLPVRPKEGSPVKFGGMNIRSTDADSARIEPISELVRKLGCGELIITADDDHSSVALLRKVPLGFQQAEVEGRAGSLKGTTTGRHGCAGIVRLL